MKILSITAQKPHSTGSGTYLTELVRAWDRAGHKQAVVCGIFPDDTVEFPDGVGCYPVYFSYSRDPGDTHVLPFPVVGMSDIMPYTSTRYRDLTPQMVSLFEQAFIDAVSQAVSDLDPDLIVCHHLFLLTALVSKHFPDRKIYGISHGSDLRQMVNAPGLSDIVVPGIHRLDRVLSLNDTQKDRIAELFDIGEERIRVIGSGYNDRLFTSHGRAPRAEIIRIAEDTVVPVMITYAGKMSWSKGVPELLDALDALMRDPAVPYFEVTLAGGCPDDEIRRRIESLPDSISWLGQIRQDHLADIFRYSDIFVLPSYYEGLPLVLIEAMASGAVPVCTDLPGVRPWIEANVAHHNVHFVPMPEMASVDQPTEDGRRQFTTDLTSVLRSLIIEIAGAGYDAINVPDTSGITWDGVAARILSDDI